MTFTYLFYKHIMFRHSCGVCHFTNIHRPSDITLADFWGWEKNVPGMNDDDKGISLVLLNTEKGKYIFDAISSRLETRQVDINKCMQRNMRQPSKIHPKRLDFEKTYQKKGFLGVMKKYGDIGWKSRIKKQIKCLIRIFDSSK